MSHRSINPELRNPFSILNRSQPPQLQISTADTPSQPLAPQLNDTNCRRYKRSFDSTEKEKLTKMRSLAKIYDHEIQISHQALKEKEAINKTQNYKGVCPSLAY